MKYLKYCRLNLGLTQEQVAERARISQGQYSDYERGIKKPRPRVHRKLAEALERPVEEFTVRLYGAPPGSNAA